MCDCLGIHDPPTSVERCTIESANLMQLIRVFMQDLEAWLENVWRVRAIRYNHMLKDFDDPPSSYLKLVSKFEKWREGLLSIKQRMALARSF